MILKKPARSWVPRSFQERGVGIMIQQACAGLLFDPGMGKTTTSYAAFSILLAKGFVERMLVVAPLRVAYNVWPVQCKEWKEFQHLRVGILHGPGKDEVLRNYKDYDILCINPEGLAWLMGAKLNAKKQMTLDPLRIKLLQQVFQVLLVDESTKFKDSQTTRFKIMKQMVPKFKRRYILTGTITPNGLMDLFGQIYILDEGQVLGRYITHYRNAFFYPSGFGGYTYLPQPDAEERIVEKIKPLVIRLDADDYLKLPKLINNDIMITLPPAARKVYDRMDAAMMADVADGRIVAANAAVASSKCRQIANGGLYTGEEKGEWADIHDAKLEALQDYLEQLGGKPCLIAYEFDFDRQKIQSKLKIPCIGKGSTPKKDSLLIQQFRRGELTALLGHPETISLGLDGLQDSCHNIFWYGIPWNLLHYLQTIDRVRRQGSEAEFVVNTRLIAEDTVDERVVKVLGQKDATQDDFLTLLK